MLLRSLPAYFYVSRNPNFESNRAIFGKTYKIKVGPNVDYILSHILIKFLSGLKPPYISRKVVKTNIQNIS